MKVLFAVSDDEISEAIVKEYKKEYKEIITYKNVYYFNAIIKEVERDQTYDRIVISEELEPFTNNNYDAIDKFMFEKLDNISDEITRNTSIVLICIDRRTKGETLLSKLFGIGLYNALMGNDRNIPEVCRLLRTPRSKKEAKIYYGLGNDEIEYQKETENSVAETEIQNILAHYKRLGKNEEKYVEAFNNIAAQYNDTQLRLIIKYLPLNVKAVLETQSEKYQSIMTFSESAYQEQKKKNEEKKKSSLKMGFIENNEGKSKLSSPVIVPSAMSKDGVKKLGRKKTEKANQENEQIKKDVSQSNIIKKRVSREIEGNKLKEHQIENRNIENQPIKEKNIKQQLERKTEIKQLGKSTLEAPQMEQTALKETIVDNEQEPPKKKRGRPKKQVEVQPEVEAKPKRGRGRPRKNPVVEEIVEKEEIVDEDDILKVVNEDDELVNAIKKTSPIEEIDEDDDLLIGFNDDDEQEDTLLGFDDEEDDEEDDSFLGFDDDEEEDDEDDSLLGFDDEEDDEEDDSFLGFDDEEDDEEDDSLLGFDDEEDDEEDNSLLGFDDEEDDEEDDSLLGFDDEEDDEEDDSLLGFDDEEDESLPEFDDEEEQQDEEDDELLDFDEEEKLLPKATREKRQISSVLQENSRNEINLEDIDYSQILTPDKKIVAFVGTSKNGTSFLVNNLAMVLSEMGVKTAILDLTKNKNSYYIFTKNEEDLRNVAYSSFDNLKRGITQGISASKNLTVYTALPGANNDVEDVNSILPVLIKSYSVVLLDCDFDTPINYFAAVQEIYLVQSMDILTIQPLTYFLKGLKSAGIDLDVKARIIINKEQKVKNLSKNAIIGGISSYNDPAMSYMTKLFDKDKIINYSIPLDIEAGSKYLETLVTCELSLSGYPKSFIEELKRIAMVINAPKKGGHQKKFGNVYNSNNKFSNNMSSTLDEMKRKY